MYFMFMAYNSNQSLLNHLLPYDTVSGFPPPPPPHIVKGKNVGSCIIHARFMHDWVF